MHIYNLSIICFKKGLLVPIRVLRSSAQEFCLNTLRLTGTFYHITWLVFSTHCPLVSKQFFARTTVPWDPPFTGCAGKGRRIIRGTFSVFKVPHHNAPGQMFMSSLITQVVASQVHLKKFLIPKKLRWTRRFQVQASSGSTFLHFYKQPHGCACIQHNHPRKG